MGLQSVTQFILVNHTVSPGLSNPKIHICPNWSWASSSTNCVLISYALWILHLGKICSNDNLWVYGIQLLQEYKNENISLCVIAGVAFPITLF